MTPKTVLPTLLIIGLIFAPIGGLLVWGSGLVRRSAHHRAPELILPQVTEITLDYTTCENQTASASNTSLNLVAMPDYNYRLRSGHTNAAFTPPEFAFVDLSSDDSVDISQRRQCFIQFDVPYDLDPTVLLYYKMTNFFQNHRRYVKSIDMYQLRGDHVSVSSLNSGDCKPITSENGKAIYPCGLIANSVFNGAPFLLREPLLPLTLYPSDTYSNMTLTSNPSTTYLWSEKGIAWPGEANKYAVTPGYSNDDIAPPPNWRVRFPSYSNSTPPPNLKEDEHFQNWMRTAGLPTFTKLWGRNDNDKLPQGRYQIVAYLSA